MGLTDAEKSRLRYERSKKGLTSRPGVRLRREHWRRYLVRMGKLDPGAGELEFCLALDRAFDAVLSYLLAEEKRRYYLEMRSPMGQQHE